MLALMNEGETKAKIYFRNIKQFCSCSMCNIINIGNSVLKQITMSKSSL